MDKRKFNGGHSTKGYAGRKPKAEEQKLIEKLTPLEPKAFESLEKAIDDGESWAIKLYFDYTYGKPKETKDINVNKEQPLFPDITYVSEDNGS